MNLKTEIHTIGKKAQHASQKLALLSTEQKNQILIAMAAALEQSVDRILEANQQDVINAKKAQISAALIDRLLLDKKRILAIASSIRNISSLADPIGQILSQVKRDNGLVIQKIRVPIGVIGVIYESRPNVTVDVSALCLKTSNAVILRGGSDAMHSNQVLIHILIEAGKQQGMPEHALQLITNTQRESVKFLVQMPQYVDLIIPRGGENLIRATMRWSKVPVIKHYKGICHTYVDASANLNMALNICENAKCQRPGVCNSMETLLIHQAVADKFVPMIVSNLERHGVQLRGDKKTRKIIPGMKPATQKDWQTEYLDLILSIKIVDSVEEAIEHINHYGSHHSDAIVAESTLAQQKFRQQVDSATVYLNASTRFTDGGEFGMGAEIGISTEKLHARGPMGLAELTTYKYIIKGTGQIRES